MILPTEEELDDHEHRLESINEESNGNCVWLKLGENK